jgi:hypothetical protein
MWAHHARDAEPRCARAAHAKYEGTEDAPGPVYQSVRSVVNFSVESKLIDNAPSVDGLLDPQLIRHAR